MKTNLQNGIGGLTCASALVLTLQPFSVRAQGSLSPPGPPGPTMKTLQQVEPRTPIASLPYTISQPGSYYLTTNLTVSGGNAIVIATNGVTLDLNGFTLRSTASPATGTGILINSGLGDIAIFNGHIRGGVTYGGGVYNGPGFGSGIGYSGTAPGNVRVSGLNVSGCLYDGIYVGTFDSAVVEACAVRTVGGNGIVAGVVKGSVALECGGSAIVGASVSDCRGTATGSGYGVAANTVLNCSGQGGSAGVYAVTAQNCYGTSSSGAGVYADRTAENCYGTSSSGPGVNAATALNCYGISNGGYGVYASTAQNCYGSSSGTGAGVYASAAQNCYGVTSSSSGDGVFAFRIAQNCYGSSSSGYGVYARTALNCYGDSSSGTGVYASTAQNCYGSSSSGFGVSAISALNCYGFSGSSPGVSATTAQNCYGSSSSGFAGLEAGIATFSVGSRSGGRAIQATIANGCWAASGTNLITYKYNMP